MPIEVLSPEEIRVLEALRRALRTRGHWPTQEEIAARVGLPDAAALRQAIRDQVAGRRAHLAPVEQDP